MPVLVPIVKYKVFTPVERVLRSLGVILIFIVLSQVFLPAVGTGGGLPAVLDSIAIVLVTKTL